MSENMFFPISAINHYSFCPRRCALVHLECLWGENYFTTSGKELHAKVDVSGSETRKERRIARSLRLFSKELGVSGIADLVEFRRDEELGAPVLGWQGRWIPYPVEYKWGSAKNEIPYERQLCAQAICLEEMLHVRISEGALYLGVKKLRRIVKLDDELRKSTKAVCGEIHQLLLSGNTPPPVFTKACKSCSLFEVCRPECFDSRISAKRWIDNQVSMSMK